MCHRHWAVDVESGNGETGMEHNSTCSLFSVIITLTDEGLDHLSPVRRQSPVNIVWLLMYCAQCYYRYYFQFSFNCRPLRETASEL